MSQEELLRQIEEWNQAGQYWKIIHVVDALPPEERGYELTCQQARACNNLVAVKGEERSLLEKAAALLESVREEGKEDPLWHFRLGYSYYHLHRLEEAAVCFREALRLDPEDEDARDFLGFIRRKGDTVNKVGGKKGGKVQ